MQEQAAERQEVGRKSRGGRWLVWAAAWAAVWQVALQVAACGKGAPAETASAAAGDLGGGSDDIAESASAGDVAADDAAGDVLLTDAADLGAGDGGPQFAWDDDPDCDPLQPSYCALPWPSNRFLVADKTTPTGYRVQFGATSLPINAGGKHVDGKIWERLDGYSVAGPLLVHFANVDLAGIASETDMAPSLAADAKIRLWAVKGSVWQRVPYWVELDSAEDEDARKLMHIRPGVILDAGTRYVVAMTGLQDTAGKAFTPSPAFAALLGNQTAGSQLGQRQEHFSNLFVELKMQGMDKAKLLLAWDFVTASDAAMHGDMLSMRDQAFQIVGPAGPVLTVTAVEPLTEAQNKDIAYEVRGTFRVPHFMEPHPLGSAKSYVMHRGPDGKPLQDGFVDMPFWVRIPRDAVDGPPFGLNQYGHGLNGEGTQVRGNFNGEIGQKFKLIAFACNWTGMSHPDVPGIIQMILDFSDFNILSDHLQQGMMESLLLMRAMRERFADLPEIKKLGVKVDKSRTYYTGISQGGIYGGTYMALSTDVTRGHLGVPGQSYSLLLQRSTDFEPFLVLVKGNYPDAGDRMISLALIQMLWDAADPASYYVHLKQQPFPGTPPHEVMLVPARGDFQVAPVTSEIAARSGFAAIMKDYGKPVFGVTEQAYPYKGSGVVIYDFGNAWAAPGNKPPAGPVYGGSCKVTADCPKWPWFQCDAGVCVLGDPHDRPQRMAWRNDQLGHFLDTGEIIDVCGGDGCHPD